MTMPNEQFKSEMRLIIQASIIVEDETEGSMLYSVIKEVLKAHNSNVSINAQVMKFLEPCCKDRKDPSTNEKNLKLS